MNKTKPLFMWAGGKTKHIKHLEQHFPNNFNRYIEPFFGGGAVFLYIKEKNPNIPCIINDINIDIINIYKTVKNDCVHFIEKLNKISEPFLSLPKQGRKDFYYNLRHKHAYEYKNWDDTTRTAILYFLMKTGFNGIWQINKNTNNRYGTPAGLLNQKDKVFDEKTILSWNKLLQNVKIYSTNYYNLLNEIKENDFVYCDPPYRKSFTQYNVDFDDTEQKKLLDFGRQVKDKKANIVISNREEDDEFWNIHASDYKKYYFNTTYTAGRRLKVNDTFKAKKAKEIILTFNKLKKNECKHKE